MTTISSLVLFSSRVPRTAEFYRALGIDLVGEDHGDGEHFAADVGGVHIAVLDADAPTDRTPAWRAAGSAFPGLWVESLESSLAAAMRLAAPLLVAHEQMAWGCRAVLQDPDGRAVEINQPEHCPTG